MVASKLVLGDVPYPTGIVNTGANSIPTKATGILLP